jgi:peptidoglycan/LPS O-acetylase OafA/YrhL
MTTDPRTKPARRHDLDALRGFAMVLGIALHAALAFFPTFWPVQDATSSFDGLFDEFLHAVHGFRMPLFFLLSGFFTAMLWRRRGLAALVRHRLKRIALPLAIGVVTIVPLVNLVSERAAADQFDTLFEAIFFQNEIAVANFLEDGVDPNALRGDEGITPLHLAAFIDNADIAEILLDAGADPYALDDDGDTAFAFAFFVGSEDVADVIIATGFPDLRPPGADWQDVEGWGFGEADDGDSLELDTWLTSFHHLWFLWFLLWMVVGFALVALVVDWRQKDRPDLRARQGHWPRWLMWALVPLALVPQLAMGDGGRVPVFGPDTSAGIVPVPHVLAYYGLFFAFGALMYDRRGRNGDLIADTLGRRWWAILLPAVLLVLPIGLSLTFETDDAWGLAGLAQVIYAWAMCFGLIGLFRRFLAQERRGARYLSDSSYWLYLAHLPLIIVTGAWIRDWDLPAGVKFIGVTVAVTIVLLVSYQLFVRYSPIGTLLNGKRTRPSAATALSGP